MKTVIIFHIQSQLSNIRQEVSSHGKLSNSDSDIIIIMQCRNEDFVDSSIRDLWRYNV